MKRIIIFMLGLLGFSLASCVEMYGCPVPVQPPQPRRIRARRRRIAPRTPRRMVLRQHLATNNQCFI